MYRIIYNRKPFKKEQEVINAITTLEKFFPKKFGIKEILIGGEYNSNHIYYGPECADGPFSEAVMWFDDDLKEKGE